MIFSHAAEEAHRKRAPSSHQKSNAKARIQRPTTLILIYWMARAMESPAPPRDSNPDFKRMPRAVGSGEIHIRRAAFQIGHDVAFAAV